MILFTTAFVDLNRNEWGDSHRTKDKYIEQFWNMIDDGFEYPLVVYTNPLMREKILERKQLPENVLLLDDKDVSTFLKEPYLSREADIMASPIYKEKILPQRRNNPEHVKPEYTLLTHSKICFVRHSQKIFTRFMYYAWIDFGYQKGSHPYGWPTVQVPSTPKDIDFSRLDRKFILGSMKLIDHHVSEEEFLKINWHTIYAFSFIIHTELIEEIWHLYKAKLEYWQTIYQADDEQNLLYQLYQDRKDLFRIFKLSKPWNLYIDNLNSGTTPQILH